MLNDYYAALAPGPEYSQEQERKKKIPAFLELLIEKGKEDNKPVNKKWTRWVQIVKSVMKMIKQSDEMKSDGKDSLDRLAQEGISVRNDIWKEPWTTRKGQSCREGMCLACLQNREKPVWSEQSSLEGGGGKRLQRRRSQSSFLCCFRRQSKHWGSGSSATRGHWGPSHKHITHLLEKFLWMLCSKRGQNGSQSSSVVQLRGGMRMMQQTRRRGGGWIRVHHGGLAGRAYL